MTVKKFVTMLLLLFVVVSIAALVIQKTSNTENNTESLKDVENIADNNTNENRLIVYYLHGNVRCQTCETLESLSEKAVMSNYLENINEGTIEWKIVNYDEEGNEHFLDDFDISFQSLVVVDVNNNSQVNYENLDKIWELVRDEDAFLLYVKTNIDKHIAELVS